jgi:hypothetical protein
LKDFTQSFGDMKYFRYLCTCLLLCV